MTHLPPVAYLLALVPGLALLVVRLIMGDGDKRAPEHRGVTDADLYRAWVRAWWAENPLCWPDEREERKAA